MIYHYQVSIRGYYHKVNREKCQDYACFKQINNNVVVGAVADGISMEKHSDIAAKMATEEAIKYCYDNYLKRKGDRAILNMIRNAFNRAYYKIEQYIEKKHADYSDFDTTLVVAIYDNGTLYFGSVGDSGIIVLNANGLYEVVTKAQKDEFGAVYPLYARDKWRFNKVNNVSSALLATDGMLTELMPTELKNSKIKIFVNLAELFMNPNFLKFKEKGETAVKREKERLINDISKKSNPDDKTILVIVNTNMHIKEQPNNYYSIPTRIILDKNIKFTK